MENDQDLVPTVTDVARIDGYELLSQMETTIADHAISMVFQPMIDVVEGRVTTLEALARFPGLPVEPPDVWFRRANLVGLGTHLDLVAVEMAVSSLPLLGDGVTLAVNLSERTIRTPALGDLLRAGDPSRIVLELHEAPDAGGLDDLARLISELRLMGTRFAVDELGRGPVGFERLLALQPDFIKVDRLLIESIDGDDRRRALLTGMVAFGREIGAVVVAEGVETEAELATVVELGVGLAQGFHIGRPDSLHDTPAPLRT